MIDRLLVKLRHYDQVSAAEEEALRGAMGEIQEHRRGRTIIRARVPLTASTLLLDGMVHSYKDSRSGSRQSVQLAVPGDFIDLHSLMLKQVDHNLGALSDCRVAMFPHDALIALTERFDHLARLLWLSTVVDGAIQREALMSLGTRSAVSRLAHLFCELAVRLDVVGLGDRSGYALHANQEELSDILGMTPVHMNRMLKELRERGLVTFQDRIVRIADWDAVAAIGEFDPFYLSLDRKPR